MTMSEMDGFMRTVLMPGYPTLGRHFCYLRKKKNLHTCCNIFTSIQNQQTMFGPNKDTYEPLLSLWLTPLRHSCDLEMSQDQILNSIQNLLHPLLNNINTL